MAKNKTQATTIDPAGFLAAIIDDTRREDCQALSELMSKVTGEPPRMWGPSIVGFGSYHYRYDSGREGDMCLRRRDGAFAYQLAVVVDDARQGVNEVVRGDDLLPSAARQWHVQNALGLEHPNWWHVPWVADENGERLAKRRDSTSLASLRVDGVDPRAIVAWAARTCGLRTAPLARPAELLQQFELAAIPRPPVCLSAGELDSLRSQLRA
jgi:glutamyl/glutaminyl-tRNA synthetase